MRLPYCEGRTMFDILQLVFLYGFLGGSIKFIDEAYDDSAYPIKAARAVAVLSGVAMGFLMARDSPFSTAFYGAMLISLALARKIDNESFLAGTVLAVVSLAAFYPSSDVSLALVPLALFLAAGFVDEVADRWGHHLQGVPRAFLMYRPFSDIALFALIAAGTFSWTYALPYFAFTLSYLAVDRISCREERVLGLERIRALSAGGLLRLSRR